MGNNRYSPFDRSQRHFSFDVQDFQRPNSVTEIKVRDNSAYWTSRPIRNDMPTPGTYINLGPSFGRPTVEFRERRDALNEAVRLTRAHGGVFCTLYVSGVVQTQDRTTEIPVNLYYKG